MGRGRARTRPRFLVTISDTHFGCRWAPCPSFVPISEDGGWTPTRWQKLLNAWWDEYWTTFVPAVTAGEPYWILHNGDVIEGRHHRNTTPISQNFDVQAEVALAMLEPQVLQKNCRGIIIVRGTEAHDGNAHECCNMIARQLRAKQVGPGEYVWSEIDIELGPHVIHATHHAGTNIAPQTEGTVLLRSLLQQNWERLRWGNPPVNCIIRGHAHYFQYRRIAGQNMHALALPPWQLKNHHATKVVPDKAPQIGGAILEDRNGRLEIHEWQKSPPRRAPKKLT